MGELGDNEPEEEEEAPLGEPDDMLKEFIARRKTHNALIQGTALNHMTKALALAEGVLAEQAPGLYNKQKALSDASMLFHYFEPIERVKEMAQMGIPRQGQSEVTWDEEGNQQARANATLFPILVQEISKAVAEANYAHGLGREGELTPEQQRQFKEAMGGELQEAFYFMMGPALASQVNKALAQPEILDAVGEGESKGADLAYARALFSMIPGNDVHQILADLTGYSPVAKRNAMGELRKALLDAETRSQM